ncbi:MAG: patatin family protein [Clostridia bacterium]|nr:patatin family protein [Clostridia bacterium]
MKTGLVMEGGAMRGMFTCGVIDTLMEHDISFDGAIGISAGAVFGCNYQSRQIGRAIRYNLAYCRDPRYCSLRSYLKTGDLYGVDFCYHEIPDRLDPFDRKAFRENPMDFFVGATDVATGKPVYHLCRNGEAHDMLYFQASASMPFVSRKVEVDGLQLLDGGISDPVPYAFMQKKGYDRLVLILTQPRGYRKKSSALGGVFRAALRKTPKLAEAMAGRPELYNRQMEEIDSLEASGQALVIRPPAALQIGHTEHDPRQLQRVYDIGREVAMQRLKDITKYLV